MVCRRDMYSKKIMEQENFGKALREKQKSIRDNQETSVKQVKMWRDVQRLMQCKLQLALGPSYNGGGEPAHPAIGSRSNRFAAADDDRLVL